jgi:hypothetical protein
MSFLAEQPLVTRQDGRKVNGLFRVILTDSCLKSPRHWQYCLNAEYPILQQSLVSEDNNAQPTASLNFQLAARKSGEG